MSQNIFFITWQWFCISHWCWCWVLQSIQHLHSCWVLPCQLCHNNSIPDTHIKCSILSLKNIIELFQILFNFSIVKIIKLEKKKIMKVVEPYQYLFQTDFRFIEQNISNCYDLRSLGKYIKSKSWMCIINVCHLDYRNLSFTNRFLQNPQITFVTTLKIILQTWRKT